MIHPECVKAAFNTSPLAVDDHELNKRLFARLLTEVAV
jgi:hypothetical protein